MSKMDLKCEEKFEILDDHSYNCNCEHCCENFKRLLEEEIKTNIRLMNKIKRLDYIMDLYEKLLGLNSEELDQGKVEG